MKKVTGLLAAGFMALALGSCGNNESDGKIRVQNVSGGSADEQQAIQDCISKKTVVSLSGNGSILPGSTTDFLEDNGDFAQLTTSQSGIRVNGKAYTVSLEWAYDKTSTYYAESVEDERSHEIVYFNYPGKGGQTGEFSIKLNKITCGGASSSDTGIEYKANIVGATYFHKDVKIAELNKLKDLGDGNYGYEIVDYVTNPKNAYFTPNPENKGIEEKQYYYVNCAGKVIYAAPDGNWGLIADGDQIMEIYAGSALDIGPSKYPAMKDSYVKVVGNMSQYLGNVQIGFITQMKRASKTDLTAEPTMTYAPLTKDIVEQISREDGTHYQCVEGLNLSNSLRTITGTYVPGSLKDKDGKTATKANITNNRFTFDMDIGDGTTVTVAYDYHVDREGTVGVFDAVKSVIDSTAPITINGTLRFNGADTAPFNQVGGHWQLVPYLTEHIVK